jgi:putative DNA primase/helicase
MTTSNISPPAMFRSIEKFQPTLIIDEADAFFSENEDLRGIINSGHTRPTAYVIRTVGDDHEPKKFTTWAFKAIAGIGKRAATIEDRSIGVALKRKLPDEKIERLRYAPAGLFETVARKLARWALDNAAAVAAARPALPESLNDRQQDNWEPLLAIAAVAGGSWPERARSAATAASEAPAEESTQMQLLLDIRDVFEEKNHEGEGCKEIFSEALVTALLEMQDRPWGECNKGKALTQNKLARMLKPYGVATKTLRNGVAKAKGYGRKDFTDAFNRYLSPSQPWHCAH